MKKTAKPTKKSPAKTRTTVQKKSAVPDNSLELAKELRALIPRLDAEGLQFLIEQAQVHLYNMQVEELNSTLERSPAKAAAVGGTAKQKKTGDELRIEATESGSSYYVVYNKKWIMFSGDEIISMVKIVNGPGPDLEIRERLYNWFDRERRDIFESIPMQDKFDERLKKLSVLLKKTFKVRYKQD